MGLKVAFEMFMADVFPRVEKNSEQYRVMHMTWMSSSLACILTMFHDPNSVEALHEEAHNACSGILKRIKEEQEKKKVLPHEYN